jgi:uncharacterized phage protein (TIGR02220 family)
MSILSLLASNSFLTVNKTLAQKIGLDAAVIFADLASAHIYWEQVDKLSDGYFYRTQSEIETNTTIGVKAQLKCIKILQFNGLIKTKLKGLPAVKHYKIDETCIANLLNMISKKGEHSLAENTKLDSTKTPINNNRINKKTKEENIINKYNVNQEKIEDVKYYFEFTQIINLLEERTNAKYKLPLTGAALNKYKNYITIKERLDDGATIHECLNVIETKFTEWMGSDMQKYLVIETLFRKSNFEKYLVQSQIKTPKKLKDDNGNYADTKAGREQFILDIREGATNRFIERGLLKKRD